MPRFRLIPRRRRTRFLVVLGVAILITWLTSCIVLVANPHLNHAASVDAVLVLGPPTDVRLGEAKQIVQEYGIPDLVVSLPNRAFAGANSLCDLPSPAFRVTCFVPDPSTTQGEAATFGDLAKANNWTSVIVITSKFHVSRARMMIDDCFSGRVLMIAPDERITLGTWAYQYFYQTAGYVKAKIVGGC